MAFIAGFGEAGAAAEGAGQMFGPSSAGAAWGGSDASEALAAEDEGVNPNPFDVGGGNRMQISPELAHQILYSAESIAAITERAQQVVDLANSMAITPGAKYRFSVGTGEGHSRPIALVMPDNFKAVVDDAAHSTLLAAAASVGSDPKYESGSEWGGGDENPEAGSDGMSPGEASGAMAGEAAEGAEATISAVPLL